MRTLTAALALFGLALNCAAADSPAAQGQTEVFFSSISDPQANLLYRELRNKAAQLGMSLALVDGSANADGLAALCTAPAKKGQPLMVYTTDPQSAQDAARQCGEGGRPLIFMGREPGGEIFARYSHTWFVGPDRREAGAMQAQLLGRYISATSDWDHNGNGTLDYVLLTGEIADPETQIRTKSFKASLRKAQVKALEVGSYGCDWGRDQAEMTVLRLMKSAQGEQVEAIVCNSDTMAAGAADALSALGYNAPGGRYVAVVGIDGIAAAHKRIKQGVMYGTVRHDAGSYAEVALRLARQLAAGEKPSPEELGYTPGRDRDIRIPYLLSTAP